MCNVSSMGTFRPAVPNAVNARGTALAYNAEMANEKENQSDQRQHIRDWRLHRGMSLDDLMMETGIPKGRLSEIERGKRRYNQDQIEIIADALGCTPGDLLDVDPSKDKISLDLLFADVPDDLKDQAMRTVESAIKSFKRTG